MRRQQTPSDSDTPSEQREDLSGGRDWVRGETSIQLSGPSLPWEEIREILAEPSSASHGAGTVCECCMPGLDGSCKPARRCANPQ